MTDVAGDAVWALVGDGGGGFLTPLRLSAGPTPVAVAIGRFDLGAATDIAVIDETDARLRIYRNTCPTPETNLTVAAMEVTQTVQDLPNTTMLVAGRRRGDVASPEGASKGVVHAVFDEGREVLTKLHHLRRNRRVIGPAPEGGGSVVEEGERGAPGLRRQEERPFRVDAPLAVERLKAPVEARGHAAHRARVAGDRSRPRLARGAHGLLGARDDVQLQPAAQPFWNLFGPETARYHHWLLCLARSYSMTVPCPTPMQLHVFNRGASRLLDTTLLPDGDYTVEVAATDMAGNRASTSVAVHVANAAARTP